MLSRLAVLAALCAIIAPGAARAAAKAPTLDVTKDAITIQNADQKLSLRLADGVLTLETPYGTHDLTVSIGTQGAWAHPGQVIVPPKSYRAKDVVTAVVTFSAPEDRKLSVRLSACPGIPAVFVTSGVTGLFGASRDYYFWSWKQATDGILTPGKNGLETRKAETNGARFGGCEWVCFPESTGGLAVISSGMLGAMPGEPFVNALPRWRFLRPGETLNISFGLAGVADAAGAAAVSNVARGKHIAELKPFLITKQARIDYGEPAPEWLRGADIYNGWYRQWSDSMINDWMKGFPLIVGVPASKATIAKAHAAGLRVVVYVNFMELQNSDVQMQAKGHLYRQPDEAGSADLLDIAKHSNWTCIDSEGNERRSSYGVSQDIPGLFSTCFHQAELRENALKYVINIMQLGADGIFIDNACPMPECYGPKFGKHEHRDAYATNTDAYEELQKEIYAAVKTFGEDKIVMQNSGIAPSHWAYCDAQMWEGFRYDEGHGEPVNEWAELQYAAKEHADAVRHGKVPVILSYFSSVPADKRTDAVLYTYAYTRLYGFLMADWFDLSKSPENQKLAKAIYGIRLGKPLGKVQQSGAVLYRLFENGVVALNPGRSASSAAIPVTRDGELSDIAYGRKLKADGKTLKLEMTPESGRVLVWAD